MLFRPDIHALRAFAVLAVLLFHFDVPGFSGGFSGVDIFFVLSGFLMTGIILQGMERGDFSIWRFYWSRARRIIPALTAVCAALLVFGWFWLAPSEYERLGWHAASSLGFFSNFVYKDESGYFDTLARQKWLLHTWALSVEWQFYLLYPLFLAAIAKWGRSARAIGIALVSLALLSLGACIAASPLKPDFAFFILVTRIWEMVAGGLVYLYLTRQPPEKNIRYACVALAVLAGSLIAFHGEMRWPGYYALVPVLGAAAFIVYAPHDHWLTDNIMTRKLGDWSYSLYLWHWPVVAGFYYFDAAIPGWQAAGLGLSVLLGAASYRWIEQPARRLRASRQSCAALFMPAVAVALAGLLILSHHGVPARVSETVRAADRETDNKFSAAGLPKTCTAANGAHGHTRRCQFGDGEGIGAILWGDSHAGTVLSALNAALGKPVALHTAQCPVILNARMKGKTQKANCAGVHAELLDHLATAPPSVPLVIVSRFSAQLHGPNEAAHRVFGIVHDDLTPDERTLDEHTLYRKKLIGTLCRVAQTRPVYILKPIPEMALHVPRTIARQLMTGRTPDLSISMAEYNARHALILDILQEAARECGVYVLDTPAYLCPDGARCDGEDNGRPLYSDDDHLSEFGNKRLIPMFNTIKQ